MDRGQRPTTDSGSAALSVRILQNCAVYPTIRVASRPGKLLMGVFDAEGGYVEGSALERRSGEQGAPVPRDLYPDPVESREPEAIYAGTLYYHFGHFLLESLARAWYAGPRPDLPLVWAGAHDWQGYELQPWQREILALLGVQNPTRIVADPTRFQTLHIPDIGYRYDDTFHPEHAQFLGRYEGPPQIRGRRLWLSRSKIGTDVRNLNAAPAERRLAADGWSIVHPEKLTVRDQLDELSRATTVGGEEGSAFHLLMLLKDVSGKKVNILRRFGSEHRNLRTIGDVRRIDQTFHTLEHELVLRAEGRVVSKISPNSAEILDLLRVPIPAVTDAMRDPDDPILERIVTHHQPRSLLDVDAAGPDLAVGPPGPVPPGPVPPGREPIVRVAVSRRFAFDPRSYAESTTDFYELALDQYVELFHGDRVPFDLIRIGGTKLPTVMAAFEASKRVAHEDTVWLFGVGQVAATAALAVRSMHPGFGAQRLFVGRKFVFVAHRVPGEPTDAAGLGKLSPEQVKERVRRLPLSVLSARSVIGDGLEGSLGKRRTDQIRRLEKRTRRQLTERFGRGSHSSRT
ncbi:glycosyltransferase 61 family protein [Microlunatus ginsengisoli]